MVRTQIQLSEDDHRRLKQYAQSRGISVAEAVRRGVAELLAPQEAQPTREQCVRRFLSVAGRHRDCGGLRDVAEQHDRHLAEAYGDEQ